LVHSFCIKFVTPLLIGGAEDNRYGDDVELTGKALRGCWRFWFRALVGGCLEDCKPDVIAALEKMVFGSTDNATFRLLVEPVSETLRRIKQQPRLPHKSGGAAAPFYDAIAPGSTFRITIVPRHVPRHSPEAEKYEAENYRALFLTIWAWAYLGAVGNRARRGFGSPVLCESKNRDDAFNKLMSETANSGFALPPMRESFKDETELVDHLKSGLKAVCSRFSQYLENQPEKYASTGDIETNTRPRDAPFFILSSLNQISVGAPFPTLDGPNGALSKVHGKRDCPDLGKSGYGGRWASPVFIRFHITRGGTGRDQYIPLMTWCHQEGVSSSPNDFKNLSRLPELRQFLKEAHFDKTLSGGNLYEF
jgi:CRISPR type III-B/RAMP module RAMP protein Cmr1